MAYSTTPNFRTKSGLTTAEVSDVNVALLIGQADAEIENTIGQTYDDQTARIEFKSVYLPKRADDITPNVILLDKYPVQIITEFLLLDSSGSTNSTLDTMTYADIVTNSLQQTDTYFINPAVGLIELTSQEFDFVPQRAKITYSYGYASVPAIITELSSTLASMRGWVSFMGGNFDRVNSYSLPEQSYDKGDFYDRGLKAMDSLKLQAESLFNQIGKKQRSQIAISSGGYF